MHGKSLGQKSAYLDQNAKDRKSVGQRLGPMLIAATFAVMPMISFSIARADQNLSDQLRDAQTQQQHLRDQTTQVAKQLDEIIAEFHRNGLDGGPDLKTIVAIRSVLTQLSDKDMVKIISLLQQARTESGDTAINAATNAHAAQATVIAQMQTLLREYQHQQAINDLAQRLAALADQQNVNLGYAVQTVRASGGRPLNPSDPNFKDSLQVQVQTQTTLQTDIQSALADLAAMTGAQGTDDGDRLAKAQKLAGDDKIPDQVSQATLSIRSGTLIRAAGQEKTIRDQLRNISRTLSMPQDTVGKLREAAKEIESQIAQQKSAQNDTKAADLAKPDAAQVEQKQADVVDKTDLTRKDLEFTAPAAADDLKKAQDKMQTARSDINTRQKDAAGANQQAALDQLEQAKKDIADQITKELAKNDTNKNNLDKVKDLVKEAAALKADQDKLKQQTADANSQQAKQDAANAQKQLQQKAQDLEQRAAENSPPAAQSLQDAAKNMDKAQDAINGNQKPKAADEQQQASDALDKAKDQLSQDEKKLADADQEEQKLADLRKKLQVIIDHQVKLDLETGKTAGKPNAPKAVTPAELATRQGAIGDDTDGFKEALPDDNLAAAAPLTDAKQSMDQAGAALNKPDAKAALPPQKDATASLYKALNALDQKLDDLKQELGKPDDQTAQQQQDLSKALQQAQQQTADAQDKIQNQDSPPPADQDMQRQQLAKAQQDVAKGLQDVQKNPPADADKGQLDQAQKAASKAADDLKQDNLPQAAQDMQKADQAMQQAQAGKPDAGKDAALPKLAAQQKQLEQQLAQQMGNDPQQALDQLAQQVGQMAAGDQAQNAPDSVKQAMQEAQQQLAGAAQQAQAGNKQGAAQAAGKAQQAMAQAQAGLAMAQSGMADAGQQPGPPGPGKSNDPADENNPKQGTGDRQNIQGKPVTDTGHVDKSGGTAQFIGLPPRDQQALQQSKDAKYPQAYSQMIEQYRRNLSDDDNK